jgi:hypothetical protein
VIIYNYTLIIFEQVYSTKYIIRVDIFKSIFIHFISIELPEWVIAAFKEELAA